MKSITSSVIVSSLFMATLIISASEPSLDLRAVHRTLRWNHPDGGPSLAGLYLVEFGPSGMVSRVLSMTPEHRFLILTDTLDPRRGLSWTELSDPEGKWKARVEDESGLTRSTLGEYFRATEDLLAGDLIRMRLILPDGLTFEAQVPLDYPSVMHAEFLRALIAAGSAERVASAIPEDLKSALIFLDGSLSPSPLAAGENPDNIAHSLRGPIEILAGAVRYAEAERYETSDEPWSMEVGPAKQGLVIEDPELVELVAHFPALQVFEPLADHRVRDVLGVTEGSLDQ